jgi:hypothetical protein
MASSRASVAWIRGLTASGSDWNMAPLYHGRKQVVHLAYLTYVSVWLAVLAKKIKIVRGGCPHTHSRRKALPTPTLVGTHFTAAMLVSTN